MRLDLARKLQRESLNTDVGSSFRLVEFQRPNFPFYWHSHSQIELTLIRRGRGIRYVGDSIANFSDGDLCLLGSELPHTYESQPRADEKVGAVVLQFDPHLLDDRAEAMPELRPIQRLLQRSARGLVIKSPTRDLIADALAKLVKVKPDSPRRLSGLINLLAILSESKDCSYIADHQPAPPLNRDAQRRLDAVFAHINQHWHEPISQTALAARLDLSPAAFSRFFRRSVGRTFISHLCSVRIGHACRKLMESAEDISQIAFSCGFDNLSNFNRQFRRLKKMSPRDYRKLIDKA